MVLIAGGVRHKTLSPCSPPGVLNEDCAPVTTSSDFRGCTFDCILSLCMGLMSSLFKPFHKGTSSLAHFPTHWWLCSEVIFWTPWWPDLYLYVIYIIGRPLMRHFFLCLSHLAGFLSSQGQGPQPYNLLSWERLSANRSRNKKESNLQIQELCSKSPINAS